MNFKKKSLLISAVALCFGASVNAADKAPLERQIDKHRLHHTNTSIIAPVEPMPTELLRHSHSHADSNLNRNTLNAARLQNVEAAAADCDTAGYGTKTGQELVDHILNSPGECINDLYDANETSFAAFQSANMLTVANAASDLAEEYSAQAGSHSLNNLYYFIRTGYYHEFYSSDHVGPYGSDVKSATRQALDNLINNKDFYASSDQHGKNIQDAIILVDSAEENARYLPMVKEWLTRWDESYAESWYMRRAVNGIFTVLFRGHYLSEFVSATGNDVELIKKLGEFSRQDWMLDSSSLYLQENSAAELARFLQYTSAAIYPTVKQEVQKTLDQYRIGGPGQSVWLRVAEQVDYLGQCAEFDICGFKQELEAQVLPLTHTCSDSLKMRAEEITEAQFDESCEKLAVQEVLFHKVLGTNNNPVADDHNTNLEMVIFNNSASYQAHAGLFYGISTNNGGMYLEGNPSNPDNQARFIAYEAEWLLPDFHIWNLTHEYVHYLDGRFNLKGDFGAAKTNTHKTVWWIEGLAEYISRKNLNDEAIALARTQQFSLSEILSNNYNSGQDRVYRWGYLAVRFMFEKHHDDVNTILTHFRAGDYDAYLDFINNGIGSNYDSEWNEWLAVVESNTDDITPDPTPEPDPNKRELKNGETVSGLKTPKKANKGLRFYIDLPKNATDLRIEITGGTGDADLYVRAKGKPKKNKYDCRPFEDGNNEVCEFAKPRKGRWWIEIKSYERFEGVSLTASYTEPASPPGVDLTELIKGETVAGLKAASSKELNFYIDVPANSTDLSFNLFGGRGDGDLLIKRGSKPTKKDNDCFSDARGNEETCEFSEPQPGRWYVVVKAYSKIKKVSLVADYTASDNGSEFDACATSDPVTTGNVEEGTPVCVAANTGISYFYTYVNAGTNNLIVELSGGTGNGDLYGSVEAWADSDNAQFSSTEPGNSEYMVMSNPPEGWVYFSVLANPEHGDTSLRVTQE
ncbi:M9 family metallopeptidase [Aliikangiella coralliicola]|uniref:microbial collagenase n=1 Tax=Aliikangiella coralliicola TaxID=2592383 RepID=A0A545UJJ4_9GAMM|nr:M9 family metallopeptidase [Aliikangiella coralliicola]TQV89603.1 collagenase [Aliikangiella coralliicola]